MDADRAVSFLRARFRGTTGDILICGMPDPPDQGIGKIREWLLPQPLDEVAATALIAREAKRKQRGLFFCCGTIRPGATKIGKLYRCKPNIHELPGIHGDLDWRFAGEPNPTAAAHRLVARSEWPVTSTVLSGGGLHLHWRSPRILTSDDFEEAEACMQALVRYLGLDPQAAEYSRLLRLPGSRNWKYEPPRPVVLASSGEATLDIGAYERIATTRPLVISAVNLELQKKVRTNGPDPKTQSKAELNPYEAYAAEEGIKEPIDAEARLLAMEFKGEGLTSVHCTERDVTASLLSTGMPRDEVIDKVFDGVFAHGFAKNWNKGRERKKITGMADTWIAKIEVESEAKPIEIKPEAPVEDNDPPWFFPLSETVEMRAWLYGRQYVREFASLTVGMGGAGKSSLVIAEKIAMNSQNNLIGSAPDEPLKVWYHNGEDPLKELRRRFQATMIHYEVKDADLGERLLVTGQETSIKLAHLNQRTGKVMRDEPKIQWVKDVIKRKGIDVFTADPAVALHSLDENSNTQMAVFAEILNEIARECHCAVHIVHHPRKTGGEEVTAEHARGASALVAASRSVRVINTMTEEDAQKFGVIEHRKNYFKVESGKANMHRPPDAAEWYRTVPVSLPNGLGGQPGDEVGVVTRWDPPGMFRDITQPMIDKALAAVRECQDNGSPAKKSDKSADWVGKIIAPHLELHAERPADRRRLATIVQQWISNKMLKVVIREDRNRKPRECIEI